MPHHALLMVTGASGAGKTTIVRALEARRLVGVRCCYFDAVGVPSPEEMVAAYGSGEAWQAAVTKRWIDSLAASTPPGDVSVLEGQMRPSVIRQLLATVPQVSLVEILLVDCSHTVREARLRNERGQPELGSLDMAVWAGYLRGQGDALALPRLDTSEISAAAAVDLLQARVLKLRSLAAA